MIDDVSLIALSQLAQRGGKAEQGLVDLAALGLPQQLRIHQELLCTRHVHQVQPRDLHMHAHTEFQQSEGIVSLLAMEDVPADSCGGLLMLRHRHRLATRLHCLQQRALL